MGADSGAVKAQHLLPDENPQALTQALCHSPILRDADRRLRDARLLRMRAFLLYDLILRSNFATAKLRLEGWASGTIPMLAPVG